MSVKRVEVVERSEIDTLPLPLLSCELWMFMKENPDRKKNSDLKSLKIHSPTLVLTNNLRISSAADSFFACLHQLLLNIAFKTLTQDIFPVFLKTNSIMINAHDIHDKLVPSNWLDYSKSMVMKFKNSELHSIFFFSYVINKSQKIKNVESSSVRNINCPPSPAPAFSFNYWK